MGKIAVLVSEVGQGARDGFLKAGHEVRAGDRDPGSWRPGSRARARRPRPNHPGGAAWEEHRPGGEGSAALAVIDEAEWATSPARRSWTPPTPSRRRLPRTASCASSPTSTSR